MTWSARSAALRFGHGDRAFKEESNDPSVPFRYLHRPEHDLGKDGRAVAAVRAPGLRERVTVRSPDPAEPPEWPLLRGVVAARRTGGADRKDQGRALAPRQHSKAASAPGARGVRAAHAQDRRHVRGHMERIRNSNRDARAQPDAR